MCLLCWKVSTQSSLPTHRYLKDHERRRLLTKGDQAFVSDSDDDEPPASNPPPEGLTYVQEQELLKKQILQGIIGTLGIMSHHGTHGGLLCDPC
jgi:hypothetical protein